MCHDFLKLWKYGLQAEACVLDDRMQALAMKTICQQEGLYFYLMEDNHTRKICHSTFVGTSFQFSNQPTESLC